MHTATLIILKVIFVDFLFYRSEFDAFEFNNFEEMTKNFKKEYHTPIISFIKSYSFDDPFQQNIKLVPKVTLSSYRVYERVAFSLSCNIRESHRLLQLFADETLKTEIMRKIFAYV